MNLSKFLRAIVRLFRPSNPPAPQPTPPPSYLFAVLVRDTQTGQGIAGATATIGGQVITTNRDGYGSTRVTVSIARLVVEAEGYHTRDAGTFTVTGDFEARIWMEPVAPAWATGERLLDVRGNFCNLWDAEGRIVYTPALPGAVDAGCFDDWMRIQREAGSTHVFVGPFEGGPAYPGVPFPNPNLLSDPPALRRFIERILNTPSADGDGFRPVLFLDGGGRDPRPRIERDWPTIFAALDGLQPYVIVIPAWEPVVGDWSSADVSYALRAIPDGWTIGYHGSPKRLVGSSNPIEPDDPWRGGEAEFYKSHGGEKIQIAFYQTEHGDAIYTDCDAADDACFLNRWEDYVARIGAGLNGWRVLTLVAFETVAYEAFRGKATSQQAREVASRLKRIADTWGVNIGYGNGLPL